MLTFFVTRVDVRTHAIIPMSSIPRWLGYLGPHQWNVPLIKITPDYIQVRSSRKPALICFPLGDIASSMLKFHLHSKGAVTATCLYGLSAMPIKTSLLLLYRRLFRPSRKANVMIWSGFGVIVVFYLVCIITTAAFCDPRQWPKNYASPLVFLGAQETSRCNRPQLDLSAAQGLFSTLSDIYVLAVPVTFISGLKMSTGRKVSVCGVFLVGVL